MTEPRNVMQSCVKLATLRETSQLRYMARNREVLELLVFSEVPFQVGESGQIRRSAQFRS